MFCTNCGNQIDEEYDFCIFCGKKVEYRPSDEKTNSDSKNDERITNYYDYFKTSNNEEENINSIQNNEIELINESENPLTPLNLNNLDQELEILCGGFLGNQTFKLKLLENGLDLSTPNTDYKHVLKQEVKNGHINFVEQLESRLDELLIMDVHTLRLNRNIQKIGTTQFRKQEDINEVLGISYAKKWEKKFNTKNSPALQEERKNLAKKIKQENGLNDKETLENHKKALKEIRETKSAKISIPYKKGSGGDPLAGAITGDIIGHGAGSVIGGAMGAGSMFGMLGGAVTGSIILGGAGLLLGGLISASDDGISWADFVLVIEEETLTISGKFTLNLIDINRVELSNYRNKDFITLTLNNSSIVFATPDGKALKIVLEECIKEAKRKNNKNENIISERAENNTNNISTADELIKYGELYKQGLLTEEEFNTLKKQLLNS